MNNLNSILDYLKVFNNINKRPAQEPRNMKLAKYIPRHERDNFNTPDLEQSPDSFLRPGETLEDWDTTFRRPNAHGGVQQLVQNTVDGSRPGYAGVKRKSGRKIGVKSQLIDLFLNETIKDGVVKGETTVTLAEKFKKGDWLKKVKDPKFKNIKLPKVDYKSIHAQIRNNPKFIKSIKLSPGRKLTTDYRGITDKAIEAYKKLPNKQKFAMQIGGIGSGEFDKFMKKHNLFREGLDWFRKYRGDKATSQSMIDKMQFTKILREKGLYKKAPLMPKHEMARKIKHKRRGIIEKIGSQSYEQHLDNYKRALQKYIGIEPVELKTGKKMLPLDLAHRTDIDQLAKLGAKLDPSDLGIDYYELNREGITKKGVKKLENDLKKLYQDQVILYKKAKNLKKIPEDLSKQIFLNNDEILKTIGESSLKGRLKPITLNPVTLEVKKGSIIVDDVTKQLGMGIVKTPESEIQYSRSLQPGGEYVPHTKKHLKTVGSMDDAIIKMTMGDQILKEAVDRGLVDEKVARKKLDKFMGTEDLVKNLKDAGIPCIKGVGGDCTSIADFNKGYNKLVQEGAEGSAKAIQKLGKFTKAMRGITGVAKWTGYGLLAEAGFMVPFAVGDYAAGKSWKRILGNATDYGFGPIFGQSEQEEFEAALPEGSLAVEGEKAIELGERLEKLDKQKFRPQGRIGMDQARREKSRENVITGIEDEFSENLQPFLSDTPYAEDQWHQGMWTQAHQDAADARAQIAKENFEREQKRNIALEEDYFAGATGGIASLMKK